MPKFVGCLIGFRCGWRVSLAQNVARASQLKLSNLMLVCSFGFFGLKTYFVAKGLYFVVVGVLAET